MKKNGRNLQVSGLNFMRLISLTIMLALIMPVIVNAQAGKANFAGNWVLNAEKSTQPTGGPGGAPGGAPGGGQGGGGGMRMGGFGGGDFVAVQEANLLTVTRTRPGMDGTPSTTVTKYTLDGKESVNANPRGGDSKSIVTWSADGKTLTIATSRTMDMNGESMTIKSSEAWTLTDASTITVVSKSTSPMGDGQERVSTFVYNKK